MRFFFINILFFFTLLSVNFVYGLDYKDNINSGNPVEQNSQNNIKQSQLIEKYLINYKSKIKNLEQKYEIQGSQIIKENVYELDQMIKGLRGIQTVSVEKKDASEIMKSVVEGLKIVNNNLKPYLKVKQREYEVKIDTLRIKYSSPSKKISSQINALIKKIADPMKKEEKLSLNQKQILRHLITLEEESKKLNSFGNRSFETTQELKSYLRDIIKSVRTELKAIKSLL